MFSNRIKEKNLKKIDLKEIKNQKLIKLLKIEPENRFFYSDQKIVMTTLENTKLVRKKKLLI